MKIMKKITLLLSLILMAFSLSFAQNNINVSGTFTDNGIPKAFEKVTIYYYSLDSNTTAVMVDTTSTNSTGYYSKTKNLPFIYSLGYLRVETSNCNGGLQSKTEMFSTVKNTLVIDFNCPPVNCYSSFYYYIDTLFNTNYRVNFMAFNPTNANRQYTWSFGDGNTAQGEFVSHDYAQEGTYIVCLTSVDSLTNCTYTYCDSIFVYNPVFSCYASFNSYPNPINNAIDFAAFSKTGSSAIYNWDFGDGNTGTGSNPTHTYANPGVYTVCLTMIDSLNACVSTFCNLVATYSYVMDPCSAEFKMMVMPDSTQSNASTVYFSLVNYNFGNIVYWNFGDGNTAFGSSVVHTYTTPGNYTVMVINTDTAGFCSDTVYKQLQVNRGTLKIIALGVEDKKVTISSIYPNPVDQLLNLNISAPESSNATLTIRDLSGRILSRTNVSLEFGNNTIQLNTDDLITGTYLVEIITAYSVSVAKLLKR